jgi:beta-galactosidase
MAACVAAAVAQAAPLQRSVYDFNPGWRLLVGDPAGASQPGYDDRAWKPVTLPRAWNEDDAFQKDIADLSTGIAWYRKSFRLPPGAAGGKVFLEFEGVRQAAQVYVNGKQLILHENGVMAFGVDISDAIRPGDNVIAVRTDNAWDYREKASNQRFQWSDKNFNANYGGIPKNVRLHVAGKLYQTLPLYSSLGTTGVYVYAKGINVAARTANIHAESQVRNETGRPRTFAYDVKVRDRDGRQVASVKGPAQTHSAGAPGTCGAGATVTCTTLIRRSRSTARPSTRSAPAPAFARPNSTSA